MFLENIKQIKDEELKFYNLQNYFRKNKKDKKNMFEGIEYLKKTSSDGELDTHSVKILDDLIQDINHSSMGVRTIIAAAKVISQKTLINIIITEEHNEAVLVFAIEHLQEIAEKGELTQSILSPSDILKIASKKNDPEIQLLLINVVNTITEKEKEKTKPSCNKTIKPKQKPFNPEN